MSMDRWQQYLFEQHSEATLRDWARRLQMFRFFRAFGGHAGDADALDVAFAWRTIEQLESCLGDLGIALVKYDQRPPQPELVVSYRGTDIARFPSLIRGTEWIQQPGHCEIAGIKVYIWCGNGMLKISMATGYDVADQDVAAAEAVEQALAGVTLERIDPPLDTRNYICPTYYPDYFDRP
ncbi:hypothetical protein Jab_1c22430 [Janthinobacterium sp. HH01]|nr:hypothetical protein Jab_1c22430 [Janthinobacterium sp. HH01]